MNENGTMTSPLLRVTDADAPDDAPSRSESTEDLAAEASAYTGYRKHSSGDLHSRLKTRKLLGVGETDDGDVHRSKLSQILGHSEQLYIRLPRGLRIWQFMTASMFTVMALWALLFPKSLFSFSVNLVAEDSVVLPIRLYGAALLSFAIVFWGTLQAIDKDVIRWTLMSTMAYFVVQTLVSCVSSPSTMLCISLSGLGKLLCSCLLALLSLYFYWCIGHPHTYSTTLTTKPIS